MISCSTSRKATMQQLITVYLLVTLLLPLIAIACNHDNECIFGECDQDNNNCPCNLCNEESFSSHAVCSQRTCNSSLNGTSSCEPKRICSEVNVQCTIEMLHTVKRISIDVYREYARNGKDCSSILYEEDGFSEERYYRDQTYCNGNGVAMENIQSSELSCICNDNHDGARCQLLREPSTASVSQKSQKYDTKKEKYKGGVSLPVPSASTPALAMLMVACTPCMVIGFIYFSHQRRRNTTSAPKHKQDCDTETVNIDLQSTTETSTKLSFQPINNRDDCIRCGSSSITSKPIETHVVNISATSILCDDNQLSIETNL